MSDFISEQEILKLLKKLDHDSQESESERMGSSSEAGINIEGQIKDGYIKVEQGKIIIGNPSNGGGFRRSKLNHLSSYLSMVKRSIEE